MTPKTILYGVAALAVAVVLGVTRYAWIHHHQTVQVHAADVSHAQAVTHQATAEVHDANAASLQPQVNAATDEILRLRAEVERLRHKAPAGHNLPPSTPQPIQDPVDLAPLVAKQDELIKAQDDKIQILEARDKERVAGEAEWKASNKALQAEVTSLRGALASQKSLDHGWGIGASYGSDRGPGLSVEKAIGPIRASMDVIKHPLPGGNSTLEARARIVWSF